MTDQPSDLEGLAAAAAALLIRIVELEAFLQTFTRVVELGAVEIRQTLFVNEHLHAETFPNFIVGFDLISKLELLSHAGTAGGFDAQAQANAFASAGQILLHVLGSGFSKRNGHDDYSFLASCSAGCCLAR